MGSERVNVVKRLTERLEHPYLFGLVLALFAVDLVVPDMIPFADEIMLGLLTTFFGAWKRKREERLGEADTAAAPAAPELPPAREDDLPLDPDE
jgi:hypothetical protein